MRKKKEQQHQQRNFESENKRGWGYLEFICYIIVWNIWKLKKFLMCAFGFANLDIILLISINGSIHTSLLHSSNYFSEQQQQQI